MKEIGFNQALVFGGGRKSIRMVWLVLSNEHGVSTDIGAWRLKCGDPCVVGWMGEEEMEIGLEMLVGVSGTKTWNYESLCASFPAGALGKYGNVKTEKRKRKKMKRMMNDERGIEGKQ